MACEPRTCDESARIALIDVERVQIGQIDVSSARKRDGKARAAATHRAPRAMLWRAFSARARTAMIMPAKR